MNLHSLKHFQSNFFFHNEHKKETETLPPYVKAVSTDGIGAYLSEQ